MPVTVLNKHLDLKGGNIMHSEEVLPRSLEFFSQGSSLSAKETLELILQILAWAKLSVNNKLPSSLRLIRNSMPATLEKVLDNFNKLTEFQELGENKAAFENIFLGSNFVSQATINAVLNFALDAAEQRAIDNFVISEDCSISLADKDELFTPAEVVEFMTSLAGTLDGKTVYCPFDKLCLIARHVDEQKGKASVELPFRSSMPWLINILTNSNIRAAISNPLEQPAFRQGAELQKFDISIAFPPFGKKVSLNTADEDRFGRFKERTTSISVLALRHLIAQTTEKVIVAVPSSLLFSPGAEYSLRQDLLKDERLQAVISMPSGLLLSTPIPFSILVLNLRGKTTEVRFVDGAAEQFSIKDGRRRSKLVHWEDLSNVFQTGDDDAIVANVKVEDIFRNDANLEVSRYLLPPDQKAIKTLFEKSSTHRLKEFVEFLRPAKPLPKTETGGLSAFEVSAADFSDYGYLTPPTKRVLLSSGVLKSKDQESFLRPGDIVITVKGNTGKLAIVPVSAPPAGKDAWVANQACLVMRLKSNREIDPRFLFIYLRSEIGQSLLRNMISGATVPLIHLQQLKDLKIIVPSLEEIKDVISTFEEQTRIQVQIDDLRTMLKHLSRKHWRICSDSDFY